MARRFPDWLVPCLTIGAPLLVIAACAYIAVNHPDLLVYPTPLSPLVP